MIKDAGLYFALGGSSSTLRHPALVARRTDTRYSPCGLGGNPGLLVTIAFGTDGLECFVLLVSLVKSPLN